MSALPDPDRVDAALAGLRSHSGKAYWRGLDELFDQPAFRQRIAAEFPALTRIAGTLRRRDFIKCLGAALALAGLDGCERLPDKDAYPYVRTPDGAVPGGSRFYATAVELDGVGQPVIGKCRDGRPIKLEGNPDHPASGGATDAFTQAALLGLYDPDRSAAPEHAGAATSWDAFAAMGLAQATRFDASGGRGLRLLTGPVNSPTLLRQIAAMRARWPGTRWHVHAPLANNLDEATRRAFGRPLEWLLRLDVAETVISLDDDLLGPGPRQTWQARGWAERRRAYQRGNGGALLHVAEPSPTLTGVAATDRLPVSHARVATLLAALAAEFGMGGTPQLNTREAAWIRASADALRRHARRGLLTVGTHHAPELQHIAFAINARLGNIGQTLQFLAPAWEAQPPDDLPGLVRDMAAGEVATLVILESNPAYSTPPDLDFARALAHVPQRIHAGLHHDETAALCNWHVPLAHSLESWSDSRAADGSTCLIQPLVRPFLNVRSRHEVLALLGGESREGRAILREGWPGDERGWRDALVGGVIAESAATPIAVGMPSSPSPLPGAASTGTELEVIFRADPTVHDGALADNPWLQEMPKPLTKLTWDNAVHISPALADELGLRNEDVVELAASGGTLRGPVWIVPGQARRTVLVHLGYGRRAGGHVAQDCGFDAYVLRRANSPWALGGARLHATGEHYRLACTQTHSAMEGHDFVRFVETAGDALPEKPPRDSFYPPQQRKSPAWGMAIDLDLCIGCNACATACVAENNVAMVGKEQVAMGREMHWLRIDRYFEGPPDDPRHVFQPVPCMQCENAPCEMGCPVNATVHSPDGLNLQIYNRCIGTRTCQSYCPYKVRRFNWLDYVRDDPPEMRAVRNPEVTVRDRGVMEKCTYCIQRTREAGIRADKEGRPIAEGEVMTACQQACPTRAISFGDISRPDSAVSRRKADGRDYALIEEANTRPRTTYAARIERGERKA
jgi:molybdopterin-containing oxidoreductase family iron-sulfur binding subunit